MAESDRTALATRGQLFRATLAAAAGAGVLLVTVVAPAEYGVDPTGIGRRIGLLRSASSISSEPVTAAAAATVTLESSPFRTDETTLTLAWGEGAEIKAAMSRGQHFVFSWSTTGGPVNFDMHGEPFGATDATSYEKGEESTGANGTFQAPFDGLHGWYWENFTENPVTVTLRTSGYYSKLVKP